MGRKNAREKILQAADELFGEGGFDATTTREIADHCGVNKALIHYHFKSKDALLVAVLDRYYDKLGDTLRGTLLDEGDLRQRIHRLVDVYVDFLAENRSFSRIVQREASGGKHVDRVSERMVPLFQLGTSLLHEIYPSTREGEMAAYQLLVSVYGMVISYFTYGNVLEHLVGGDLMSVEALDQRKRHLCRVIDVVIDSVEAAA